MSDNTFLLLNNRLDEMSITIDSLLESKTSLENQLSKNHSMIENLQNQINDQHSTYQQTCTILVDVINSLVTTDKLQTPITDEVIQQINEVKDIFLSKKQESNKECIDELNHQIMSLTSSNSKNVLEICKLKKVSEQTQKFFGSINDLVTWKNYHNVFCSEMKSSLDDCVNSSLSFQNKFEQYDTLVDNIEKLKLSVNAIEGKLDVVMPICQNYDDLSNTLKGIETKVYSIEQDQLSDRKLLYLNVDTISDITNKISYTDEELDGFSEELEDYNKHADNITSMLTHLNKEVSSKFQEFSTTIKSTKESLDDNTDKIDEIQNKLQQFVSETSNHFNVDKKHFEDFEDYIGESQMTFSNLMKTDAFVLKQLCVFELNKANFMGNYYDLLQQWTNRIVPHVIFISKGLKNLDVRELNNSICGKKDVMFIVVTKKNNIFGCYTSEIIPAAPARATKSKDNCLTVSNDPNHFIFSLQNTNKLSPPNAFRLKNQTDCSIGVYSPRSLDHIFTCYNFFTLKHSCCKFSNFEKYYDSCQGFKFAEEPKCQVEFFVAIHWEFTP